MGERMQSPLETALWVDCNLWWLIKCSLVAWVNWSGHLKSRKVNFTKFHVQLPTWMIHMAIFTKFHVSDFCRIITFSWISCVRREFHEIHGQTFKSLHEIHVCLEFSWISWKFDEFPWISWNQTEKREFHEIREFHEEYYSSELPSISKTLRAGSTLAGLEVSA